MDVAIMSLLQSGVKMKLEPPLEGWLAGRWGSRTEEKFRIRFGLMSPLS